MTESKDFTLVDLLSIVLKWKTPLIVITIIAAIGSAGISLVLPEYYESKTIFYPSNPSLVDRQYLFGAQGGDVLTSYFGAGDDLDRTMTVAKSPALMNHLITTFNLKEHYGIMEGDEYPMTKVNDEFRDNYRAIKNEYDAVEITVLDTSKDMAAKIANEAMNKIDLILKSMTKENKEKIVDVFKSSEKNKRDQLSILSDSLQTLRKEGGDQDDIDVLILRREALVEELNEVAKLHEQYGASLRMNIPTVYIVEKAYPAEKRKYPVRWLIVLTSTALTAFICLIFVVLIERYKVLRAQISS